MANSIKEYIAGQNPDGSTYEISATKYYTTPEYLTGRADEDLKVYVDGVLQPPEAYNVNGTSLNFNNTHLPRANATILIERSTSSDLRLSNYSDGSLLNAETLDKDATQMFFMSQEAKDVGAQARVEAARTKYSMSHLYQQSLTPPENPDDGDLWYDTSATPFQTKSWNGTKWVALTPLVTREEITGADLAAGVTGTTFYMSSNWHDDTTKIYLNGVRLPYFSPSIDITDAFAKLDEVALKTRDYCYVPQQNGYLFRDDIAADDKIVIETGLLESSYVSEVKNTEFAIQTLKSDVDQAAATAVRDFNTVESISETFIEEDYVGKAEAARDRAETAGSNVQTYADSAYQSAQDAIAASNSQQSIVEGWVTLGTNTVQTLGPNDPILFSNAKFEIIGEEGVQINNVAQPAQLIIDLDPSNVQAEYKGLLPNRKHYVERVYSGVYKIWHNHNRDANGSSITAAMNSLVLAGTPVPNAARNIYTTKDDYIIKTDYQDNTFCMIKMDRHVQYTELTLHDETGNSVDTGRLVVTIQDNI